MDNTGKNHQKHLAMATIREAVQDGSGTKSEVMAIVADYDENYNGDPRPLLHKAGYTLEEYKNWVYFTWRRVYNGYCGDKII